MKSERGVHRYVGFHFDQVIQNKQKEIKELTGKDIPYKEITDRMVFMPPIISVQEPQKKKTAGFGVGLFR